MKTVAQLAKDAGGVLGIGAYLNANPKIFQEFLDGECDAEQLKKFVGLHLSNYPELARQVIDKIKFLSGLSSLDEKTGPLVPYGKPFPMIEVGAQRGAYIPPGGAGVAHDERVGLCGCGL